MDNSTDTQCNDIITEKASSKSAKSMAIATILVMLGLVFSKCSGFLRDIFVAIEFHKDLYRDSFTLAFTIPDLVYNLLIGGSIQSALTPSLSSFISKGEEKRGFKAVSIFISVSALLMVVVCVLCDVFAEQLYKIYMIFSSDATSAQTVHLAAKASQMLFPQVFFMMLAALSIGILNAYKRFASTAFGPTVYNVFVLLSIIIFAGNSENALVMTTAGIMGAAIIYFLFQYVLGFDKLKQFRFSLDVKNDDFKMLVRRALPILFSASIVQINMVILNSFACTFPEKGQVYALRNASTVWQLPYGIFAVAVGNVMLPSLAALYTSGKMKEASDLLSSRLKTALFMTIPSAGFLIVMSTDAIKAVFQWTAAYTDADAKRAGTYLIGYSIAIITQTVIFIINQAFYAIGKTKVPLVAGAICLITNPLFCTIFIKNNLGPMSLTMSYSFTSVIQMIILCVLYCRNKDLAPKRMFVFIVKSVFCLLFMGISLVICNRIFPGVNGKIPELCMLALKLFVSFAIYYASAVLLKMDETVYWLNRFKHLIARKKPQKQ